MTTLSLRISAAIALGTFGLVLLAVGFAAEGVPPVATAAPAANANPGADVGPKPWQVEELLPFVEALGKGRNFEEGRKLFKNLMCGTCHAFSTYSQGGGLAPDLTPVGSKLTREAILQSILEPSAEINGQYHATKFTLKNGSSVEGSVVDSGEGKYFVVTSLFAPDAVVEVKETDVAAEEISKVSQMPAGLLNGSTRNQILDLMAFLISSGQSEAAVFQK